jgi:septal ring factor EnvC (AmiA/AmiB activator)
MKEEFNKNMEKPQKKESNRNPRNKNSLRQINNTIESHSSRLEHVQDRFLGLEDKINIKEITKDSLDQRLKSCERNMQKLSDSIKRPNL